MEKKPNQQIQKKIKLNANNLFDNEDDSQKNDSKLVEVKPKPLRTKFAGLQDEDDDAGDANTNQLSLAKP